MGNVKIPHIGELRSVGYFENNTAKVPYTGGYIDGYSPIVMTVRCKLWKTNSRRTDQFGQIYIDSSWNMICRFQRAIDNAIKINSKFVVGSDVYTIEGINIIDERTFWYHFVLNLKDA